MGLFRRKPKYPPPPSDLDVPEGKVAVHEDQLRDWAAVLAHEAAQRAYDVPLPEYADLYAKIAISDVCGSERAAGLPGSTHSLAYNLVVQGYACRAVEIEATTSGGEASEALGHCLTAAHNNRTFGDDWFAAVTGTAGTLADERHRERELVKHLRQYLAEGGGEAFTAECYAVSAGVTVAGIDEQEPGASESLSPAETGRLWHTGYWLRALNESLPGQARAALDAGPD